MAGKYWLVKCEFDECSFDELKQRPQSTGYWRGVRNYQARNLIRDNMEKGDLGVLLSLQLRRAGDRWNRDNHKSRATPIPANSTTSTTTTTKNPPRMSRAGSPST